MRDKKLRTDKARHELFTILHDSLLATGSTSEPLSCLHREIHYYVKGSTSPSKSVICTCQQTPPYLMCSVWHQHRSPRSDVVADAPNMPSHRKTNQRKHQPSSRHVGSPYQLTPVSYRLSPVSDKSSDSIPNHVL